MSKSVYVFGMSTLNFSQQKYSLRFYHAKKTDAGSLLDILKSALEELQLSFCNLRGQGYDGAASMSGKESGLQTSVRQENPQALWVYCFGHNLNLVVQDSIKKILTARWKCPYKDAERDKLNQRVSKTLRNL